MVPLISSRSAGPLGVVHLPRLWLKISLHAVGRLPEGYRHGVGGFDAMTFENLGIDGAAFIAYVESELPTYVQCEQWVREHATNLTPGAIATHNEMILNRDKTPEAAAEQRATIGIDAPDLRHAITLNDLDDWTTAHVLIVAHRA